MSRQSNLKFAVSTSPFVHDEATTPWMMFQVVYTLIPLLLVAAYFFGISAILLTFSSVLGCYLTEWAFSPARARIKSLKDGSALITGILLALTLPPGFPLWMAFLGGVVSIGLGKVIWGGLGQNIFNPALLGRAFLQAAFPTAITTWTAPGGSFFSMRGTNMALPFFQGENVDAQTAATPLSHMKFDHIGTDWTDLLIGHVSGSLGETCGILIILAGIYLLARRIINWRIPLSIVLAVAAFSGIAWSIDPALFPSPVFMLLSGGMLLGTVFMATDLVTSPLTPRGCFIFGAGIGILVVLIRIWGGLPEGVMYSILLMNSVTPLINRFTRIRAFGKGKSTVG